MSTYQKQMDKLFEIVTKHGASDLHLKEGAPPILRIKGAIKTLDGKALTKIDIQNLVYSMLTEDKIKIFEATGDLDTAYAPEGGSRFRVNLFRQRSAISMAARRVNSVIPNFKDLSLPEIFAQVAMRQQGLILVCGITGSGKSTTIAAMIEYINSNRRCHIVTIEDPIEYIYEDRKSFINQREIGLDVHSFNAALKTVVRQDPDVILVGEMRDSETFATALTAAETGHLVFGTLHSSTVAQTFGRIYDIFPPDERVSVRNSLMFNLQAVICQKLAPTLDESGRVPINEVMIMNPAIQKLLQKNEEKKIADVIRIHEEDGMCDFNQSLMKRVKEGSVAEEVALRLSHNPNQLKMNLKGIFLSDTGIVS